MKIIFLVFCVHASYTTANGHTLNACIVDFEHCVKYLKPEDMLGIICLFQENYLHQNILIYWSLFCVCTTQTLKGIELELFIPYL